jgi:hypothetical protein
MAALMPTVDAGMRPAFGRPKIMEALELFGVRAAPRQELLQLIQDQAPGRVVGDGMVVDGHRDRPKPPRRAQRPQAQYL